MDTDSIVETTRNSSSERSFPRRGADAGGRSPPEFRGDWLMRMRYYSFHEAIDKRSLEWFEQGKGELGS
jgi:hypothetical protein